MTDQPFTCTNCHNTLTIDTHLQNHQIKCNNCGASVSLFPVFKSKAPQTPVNIRAAFLGILTITAAAGAIGACMLMGKWNFWATFFLIGGIIYLIERLFLGKYYLINFENFKEHDISHVYIQSEGEKFNEVVNSSLAELPEKYRNYLKEINIVVEELPNNSIVEKLKLHSNRQLAGLYQGIPLTKRSVWHGNRMPDKITLFKKNITSYCFTETDLKREIKRVVRHELGHFFGLNEEELRKIEERYRQ